MIAGQLPEFLYVSWAVFDVIDLLPPERRVGTLQEQFRTTDGVGTAVDIIDTIQTAQTKNAKKYEEFDDVLLRSLRRVLVDRIRQVAQTDRILDRDFLPKILLFWKTWGDAAEASRYIEGVISNDRGFLRFLDRFIYQTTSVGGGDKVAQIKNKLNIRALATVIDIDVIDSRIASIQKHLLSSDEKLIIETAMKFLEKFKKSGLTPEEFSERRFFGDEEM
jgi:hypothetical protein